MMNHSPLLGALRGQAILYMINCTSDVSNFVSLCQRRQFAPVVDGGRAE